jgi:hypothetical protein
MADKFSKFAGIFPIERAALTDGDATIPMTLEEFAQAYCAVEQALKFFNYAPLIERLRTSMPLLGLERNIAANLIEGKIKKPKHRVAQPKTSSRKLGLALSVAMAMSQGVPRKAAVSDVAKANRVSKSTVSTALRENINHFPNLTNK